MSESIYVLGAGGHGRVVLDALLANRIQVTGILDANAQSFTQVLRVPILGGDEYLDCVTIAEAFLVNGLGANPKTFHRRNIFTVMKTRGFTFKSFKHPSAILSSAISRGEGCQVMAGVVIQAGVTLEDNVVINTRASIDHDCMISSHSFIAPGVTLCGNVTIASSAFIGAGAVVIPNIHIGENAIVGAGAVVTKPVPDGWIVAGNPAVKIGVNQSV
ncbi:acetyltransferase [Spirulina subsalsa FACHB-351]|uniref:Acetyltransferase n=1 Tax=Spirulina subsalsa FACHB-351 TaxID=234711 RepID=A0ABT3L8Q5_9CYAN|nr:acetyltransferase [Spirulina subsalsa]MCW6037895.1 acetyltransferase [Spirulina subsalsa FACHB-351]